MTRGLANSLGHDDAGHMEEIVPLEKSEEIPEVMVNVRFLRDAVRALGSMTLPGDQGILGIRAPESPLLIHAGNREEFPARVMPMRA